MAEVDAFYSSLGHQIQTLRRKRRMTQEQLGASLRPPVTRASIANVEAGKQGVLAWTLVQMANALGVPARDLLPAELAASEGPIFRAKVQSELAQKLSVAPEQSRRLTEKLLASAPLTRRKSEDSARKIRG